MNKCIQDIWESLDSHKMNLLTVRNRLARQESTLSKIQIPAICTYRGINSDINKDWVSRWTSILDTSSTNTGIG
uniref:Uncharacterized protein n=1 Tax=Magallana gigas TaxID=29159 RepID=K1PRT8_MAGGI